MADYVIAKVKNNKLVGRRQVVKGIRNTKRILKSKPKGYGYAKLFYKKFKK